ncbi:MAG: HAD family phosphatase [bacterium]
MKRQTATSLCGDVLKTVVGEPMISWIIFDLGGIVVPETSGYIMTQIAEELGIQPDLLAEAIGVHQDSAIRGEQTLLQVYGSVVRDLGLSVDPAAILCRHLAFYRQAAARHDPDFVALLHRLKKDLSVACLTNTEPEIAHISCETGLFDYFDRRYLSTELGMKKPDTEIYIAVLADIGRRPEEVLFVDDREENVTGAKSTGMHGLLFMNVTQLDRDLSNFCPSWIPGIKIAPTSESNTTSGSPQR